FCRGVLASLDASEGRRRRRKRDTLPDVVGLDLVRSLATRAVEDDPPPERFEAWLAARVHDAEPHSGPMRATALRLLEDWRLALADPAVASWYARGAPSEDAEGPDRGRT